MNDLLTQFGDREEFRVACGGQEKLDKAHADALREYEQWLSDREG